MDIDGMFVSMAMCRASKDLLGVTRGQLAERGFMAASCRSTLRRDRPSFPTRPSPS